MELERIVFKCEGSLWDMLKSGQKTWEARPWNTSDERICRLNQFEEKVVWNSNGLLERHASPVEETVGFENKATGELLTFRYEGLEFEPWAPGWAFICLGDQVL